MKTKIILTISLLALMSLLSFGIVGPTSTLAKNKVAVDAVNGGDAQYVVVEATNAILSLPWAAGLTIVGLLLVWGSPFKTKNDQ